MRRSIVRGGVLFWGALVALACAGRPAAEPPVPVEDAPPGFSGALAFEHLTHLTAIGPRVAGTEGAARARAYVREQLEALGLEVEDLHAGVAPSEGEDFEAFELETLRAVMPGEGRGLVVLATPLDTAPIESFPFVGANEGASGAALLLELARVLREQPLPYTIWLVFLDGEKNYGPERFGAEVLATLMRKEGDLDRLRLLVTFDQVGDRDLSIARDLRSNRVLRKAFFDAAQRLERADAFPMDQPFASLDGSHQPFEERGFRRYVVIRDARYGDDEAPGVYWRSEEDTPERCAPESLEAVGDVTIVALRDISEMFAKVDRFARMPEPTQEPEPEEGVGAETGEGTDAEAGPGDEAAPDTASGDPS
jgi:hypothetical protein